MHFRSSYSSARLIGLISPFGLLLFAGAAYSFVIVALLSLRLVFAVVVFLRSSSFSSSSLLFFLFLSFFTVVVAVFFFLPQIGYLSRYGYN